MKRSKLSELLEDFIDILNGPIHGLYLSYRKLEPVVIGSKLSSSFDRYARIASLGTSLSMLVLGIVAGLLAYGYTGNALLAGAIAIIVAVAIVFPLSFAITILLPSFVYSHRRSILESKFPLLAMTLSLLLASGSGIVRAFEELEKRFLDELKHFDLEVYMVNSLVRVGMPIDEALQKVAAITPSLSVKELFTGLASVARVGGDPAAVVNSIMSNYISRYAILVEKTVNDLGIMMEVYLAFALLVPIVLGSVAVLFLLSPMPGISFEAMTFLTIFIVIPVISIAILVIVDSIVSKLRV